jgi:hypothetical protein
VVIIKVLSWNFFGWTQENHENPKKDWPPTWSFDKELPKCESDALSLWHPMSILWGWVPKWWHLIKVTELITWEVLNLIKYIYHIFWYTRHIYPLKNHPACFQ